MSVIPEKRSSVIDTLVTRDRTAVFWFLVACAVGAGCAIYIVMLAEVLRKRPPFVVMDTAGAFYLPSGVVYSHPTNAVMHKQMGDLLAETLLARNPDGLIYQDRLPKLYWQDERRELPAFAQIRKHVQLEEGYFKSQRVNQTVQIDKTELLGFTNTRMGTLTTGTVERTLIFSGKTKTEKYRFSLKVKWHQNLDIATNEGFPSQVEELVELKLEPVTET
ncbi:MAG: hypothetical protein IAE77_08690 [Prosthecobacter sp.]|jgi:hypothetical protein|uniref:hypothetical protein n=1 Tax=Prosthecobacter sp. TaxID=1965333 RepID=UPI0019EA5722|nr:hypothetical protein [Prosthecobacter sp.]MBE2283527.1 hypothetical protein [Prosthecobacter sp.]